MPISPLFDRSKQGITKSQVRLDTAWYIELPAHSTVLQQGFRSGPAALQFGSINVVPGAVCTIVLGYTASLECMMQCAVKL